VEDVDEGRLRPLGADAVLPKPFPILSFKSTVRDLLGDLGRKTI
jgi:hypothetical protein